MEHLLDVTISKVYEGPDGESDYGPWQVYNLYFDGDKQKYSYMWSDKKLVPEEGMKIKHAEYEVETKGKYTNYKIKKIEIANGDESSDPSKSQTIKPQQNGNRDASFYVAYAKDLKIALIQADPQYYSGVRGQSLDQIGNEVAQVGLKMMSMVSGEQPITQSSPPQPADSHDNQRNPTPKKQRISKKDKNGLGETILCDGPHKKTLKEKYNREEVSTKYCLNACPERENCATAKNLAEMQG